MNAAQFNQFMNKLDRLIEGQAAIIASLEKPPPKKKVRKKAPARKTSGA